ncbi:MAG: M17 family peptidase N-terminal domain-containing protein [Flavobacteriales bacterium]
MMAKITKADTNNPINWNLYFFFDKEDLNLLEIPDYVAENVVKRIDKKLPKSHFEVDGKHMIFQQVKKESDKNKQLETFRVLSSVLADDFEKEQIENIAIFTSFKKKKFERAIIEGFVLSLYRFDKYKTKKDKVWLKSITPETLNNNDISELESVIKGVKEARDLVNEPQSYLTATQMSKEIKRLAKETGFKAEVLKKSEIEALEMGGLLAVNKGSVQEPTFNILTYKSKDATNKTPMVFVGKGIVYDTGGLSLKPTGKSMDFMKSDMGGAASVIGLIAAVAKAKLPVYIVGLIPATDNRPSLDAYAPGDVITMMNKMTVEVLNTDAEGRMVLADALHYAKRYNPELVIDLATLTGAAVAAFGTNAICGMGNDDKILNQLEKSGYKTYERVVPQPFWDDFGDQLKSTIADFTNLGTPGAGHITAGKFLEHFTDYPWVHLDIAGPAFLHAKKDYKTVGGSGVGVRLLFDFVKSKI